MIKRKPFSPLPLFVCGLTSGCIENQPAGGLTFAHKPNVDNQEKNDSSHEQSDDEDAEIEAGPCEQSINHRDTKKQRRKELNRESAKRSRQRRQANLVELELQVKALEQANASLLEKLTNATHLFNVSLTDHRVLTSDVNALRAVVTLAEDRIAQGSLASSGLNQILQNTMKVPQLANPINPCVTLNGSSCVADAPYIGTAVPDQNHLAFGFENGDANHMGVNSGMMSDGGSCVSTMTMWASDPVPALSM